MKKIKEEDKKEIARRLRLYQTPNDIKSYRIFLLNMLGLIFCLLASHYLFKIHPLLADIVWIPCTAFLGRFFVFIHDCGHQNLFSSKRINLIAGRISCFTVGMPFILWRHYHNVHHATTNNLAKRHLDIESTVLTETEYKEASLSKKLFYDFTRNGFVRIAIIPVILFIANKIPVARYPKKIIVDIIISTIIYILSLYFICQIISFQELLLIYGIPILFTQILLATIFALQHRFEKVYWIEDKEWSHFESALYGSSYLKFGKFMNWFSGNVGYHHIHHLNPKIPFYNLPKAEQAINDIVSVEPIYLKDYFKHLKLKVWDINNQKMVDPSQNKD